MSSSYGHGHGHHVAPHAAAAAHGHHQSASYGAPMAAAHAHAHPHAAPAAPAGTFAPGTKIQVGGHRVVIQKYLSEGGFAHVYLVKMPKPVDGTDLAVLKRVAVPDKDALRSMRTEVETMKRLKGHKPIVTYIDSHASEMRGGGYEVFLLMEYCNGGGLIDFMNTRLQHRLTEPEILGIFADIAEGVACMHYLKPPLLHRDLKVENVLITARGAAKRFKVCDFGSAAAPRAAPTTVTECRLVDEDVQKHTTLQYRSPEMVDVYRKQPIDEKSDIWALGVLLYKLCYYTTPFEDQGQLAILNASFRYPSHPVFSTRLKTLIGSMLKESISARPNIYQVLKEACAMQGREVPIQDIYATRSKSDKSSHIQSPQKEINSPQPVVGAVFAKPEKERTHIPEIAPMRRGRPTAPQSTSPNPAASQQQPSNKVTAGDPFAALDTKSSTKSPRLEDPDELSSRFPSLGQFSLLHDQGARFDFDSTASPVTDLNQRVAERLADEAFASPQQSPPKHLPVQLPVRPHSVTPASHSGMTSPPMESLSKVPSTNSEISRAQAIIRNNPDLNAISKQTTSKYVSTGTMTTDFPAERPRRDYSQPATTPDYARSSMDLDRASGSYQSAESRSVPQSQTPTLRPDSAQARQAYPRASLDNHRSQLAGLDYADGSVNRSRPVSSTFESNTLDFLRDKETTSRSHSRSRSMKHGRSSPRGSSPRLEPKADDSAQPEMDDLAYLKNMEDSKHSDKSKPIKRSSLTSLSGSKNMLAGKFGDAFKRFESHIPGAHQSSGSVSAPARTPSPRKERERGDLTPIAGSEATDGRSDDGRDHENGEHMTLEQRREMERQKLEEEERRVEAAQQEYRRRVAESGSKGPMPLPKSIGGVPRAISIQNRVQSLLSDDQQAPSVQRTAQGYGKYSDAAHAASKPEKPLPDVPRKPLMVSKTRIETAPLDRRPAAPARQGTGTSSAPPAIPPKPTGRPAAPKKPIHLNSLPTGSRPESPAKQGQPTRERIMAADLPGQPVLEMSGQERDDYIEDFSKRFPSLSAMDMVDGDVRR
jgi:AP2-associated kinase